MEARPRVSRSSGGCCEAKSPLNRAVIYKESRHEIRRDDCRSRAAATRLRLRIYAIIVTSSLRQRNEVARTCNLAREKERERDLEFSSIFACVLNSSKKYSLYDAKEFRKKYDRNKPTFVLAEIRSGPTEFPFEMLSPRLNLYLFTNRSTKDPETKARFHSVSGSSSTRRRVSRF